jgi:PAS domain S-box-containing protein
MRHDSRDQFELYRLLVENSLGLMCIHDLDGMLLAVNPAVAASLGYAPESGVGRNLRDFLASSFRGLFPAYLERIRQSPVDTGHMRLLAKDGTERIWFYRNIRYDASGSDPVVLGHALDVTDRIAAERALRQSEKALSKARDELAARVAERTADLEQANARLCEEIAQRKTAEEELLRTRKLEALGVLAGGIAHDFNNYLTIVSGNLELAGSQLPEGSLTHDLLKQATAACGRAVSLASELLAFSAGGAPIRRAMSVAQLVEGAVSLVSAGAQVGFDVAVESDLWPAELDAAQVGHVLHNILLNARQATRDGGTIEVRATNFALCDPNPSLPIGKYVKITIRDNGCGIPPENLSRIFDPYFTTKRAGSGLGLATAHTIVSRHRGHISVDSTPGLGSSFHIYLPAAAPNILKHTPAERQIHTGVGRVLVMDDQEAIRRVLVTLLTRLGYEVECAGDGMAAIEKYQQAISLGLGFDAVLLDLTVAGGMGGKEAAAQLRRLDPSARLIVSSGYTDVPIMAEYQRYGFDDVIRKPWTIAELSAVFRRVILRTSADASG